MQTMNSREQIREIIIQFEKKYPVNEWQIDGLLIWPYLRMKLFFNLRSEFEYNKKKPKNIVLKNENRNSILSYLKKIARSILKLSTRIWYTLKFRFLLRKKLSTLPKKDFIFLGANSHRINFKGYRFNRYFDTYIEENNLENNYFYYEYDNPIEGDLFKPENIIRFNDLIYQLKKTYYPKHSLKEAKSYNEFLNDLENNNFTSNFSSQFDIKRISNDINFIIRLSKIFEKFLIHTQAKKVHVLCYYSSNVFAFILAANRLGIETIEMQHGAQTNTHLAYGSWTKVPSNSYSLLPKTFWHWDEDSSATVKSWSKDIDGLKSIVVGNPWLNYWMNTKENYDYTNFILYTLQPKPYGVDRLFSESMIKLIKNSNFKWFIRLHPRQDNKQEIIECLYKNKLFEVVEIEKATNDPLPLLLKNCRLHISNSSGTTIEAEIFNKKTILIDEIGEIYYQDIINRKNAIYLPGNAKDFYRKVDNYINNFKA